MCEGKKREDKNISNVTGNNNGGCEIVNRIVDCRLRIADFRSKTRKRLNISRIKGRHIAGDVGDIFAECGGGEDLDLVAVAENPPGDFVQAVDAELDGSGAVGFAGDFLGFVPLDFGDVGGDFGSEAEADVVDAAFGNHRPGAAEVIGEVEIVAVSETLVEDVGFFDSVEFEGADGFVDR